MRKSRLGLIKVYAEEPKREAKKEKVVREVEYNDIIETKELAIADGVKLVFSVSKTLDGNPHLDIRTWVKSEKYEGPTKKGINFDVENLEEFLDIVNGINEELEAIEI